MEASPVNKNLMANKLSRIRRWDIQQREKNSGIESGTKDYGPGLEEVGYMKLRRGN